MPEWLEFRLIKINAAYKEFPKLIPLSLFYLVFVILTLTLYMPILKWAHGLNYNGNYPLQNLIAENANWLVWGQLILPLALALYFYCDISDRHDEKYLKKHGQLPKWVR